MTTQCPEVRDRDMFPVMAACKLLGVCRNTLYKYEREGFISSHYNKFGRRVYYGRDLKNLVSGTIC